MLTGADIREVAEQMVGKVIADRYRLVSVLGLGGTGVVYRATSLPDEETVAVKTIRQDLAHDRAIARFFRGARLAARLDHPGVVPTLAFGKAKGSEGVPFQVMPLVEGPALSEVATDTLETPEVIWIACRVLDALAYVHARGVLHRDIKPANILLQESPDGQMVPRITDFGIAAAFLSDVSEMRITGTSALVGTPVYMAPEQAQSGAMNGPELDLYAVGVVLFHMLSGRLPYRGTAMEILAAKATIDPPPLEVPGLDPEVASTVGRLIARDPRHRFALAAQVRRLLEPHARPLIVSDARRPTFVRPRRASVPPRVVQLHREPPGAETLARAWPTLIVPEGVPGSRAELPGRGAVLRALEAEASDVERGEVRLVSVLGEPGMGKSTILERVSADLVEQGRFLVVRAPYFKGGSQAGGVRRGIERMLGVQGSRRHQVREAVTEFLRRYDDVWPEEIDQLVDCLHPPEDQSPEVLSSRLGEQMALVVRLLRRLSQTRPVLLLIDDADKASTDLGRFLEFLLMEARFDRWPMMVLCAVGVTEDESSFWGMVQGSETLLGAAHKRIRLHAIPDEELELDLIRRHSLTQTEARRIVRRSGGNPLHASYLAEVLLEDSRAADSNTDPTESSVMQPLPGVLLELMVDRLERRLSCSSEKGGARHMLEALAVLGEAVEEDLLEQVLDPAMRGQFERILDELLSLGLVGIIDHAEPLVLGFTPGLLREAVLQDADADGLQVLHERAVDVRMGLEGPRRRSHWGAMGDHHAAVGTMEEAHRCWLKGMRYEVSAGNVMRGVGLGMRVVDHLDPTDPMWAHTALLVATMSFDAGEAEGAEALLRSVLEAAETDRALQAGDLLCDVLENRGAGEEWRKTIEDMGAMESDAGSEGLCALYCARSMWRTYRGSFEEALADAQRAASIALPGPPAQRAHQRLAFANLPHMQLDAALSAARKAVEHASDVPVLRVRGLRTLGTVQVWRGEADHAVETFEEAAQLCRHAGILTRYPIAMHDLGDAYRMAGKYADAREKYTESIALSDGLPLHSSVVLSRFTRSICDIAEGRTTQALSELDDLVSDGEDLGMPMSRRFAAFLRLWAYAIDRDVPAALSALAEIGPIDTINIDPQVTEILIDSAERLVNCMLSTSDGFRHLEQISLFCRTARDVFGGAGDAARLQRIEVLIRRLPVVPV